MATSTKTNGPRRPSRIGRALPWLLLSSACNAATSAPLPAAPDLFAPPPLCQDGENALKRAARLRESALLDEERYPFDARAGVRASHKLAEAAACLARVGEDASEVRELHARLVARVEHDYRTLRARLEHARETGRVLTAQESARRLLAMLAGHEDPYVVALRTLARNTP